MFSVARLRTQKAKLDAQFELALAFAGAYGSDARKALAQSIEESIDRTRQVRIACQARMPGITIVPPAKQSRVYVLFGLSIWLWVRTIGQLLVPALGSFRPWQWLVRTKEVDDRLGSPNVAQSPNDRAARQSEVERASQPVASGDSHQKRVLLIGSLTSPHTRSWHEMMAESGFEFTIFCPSFEGGVAEADYDCPFYFPTYEPRHTHHLARPVAIFRGIDVEPQIKSALAELIVTWKPDVIHTLGFFEGARPYADLRRQSEVEEIGRWLLQLRGGSDLELNRFKPEIMAEVAAIANQADQILSDNKRNFQHLEAAGVDPTRFSRIGVVPGAGGIDIDFIETYRGPAPRPRHIVWPKAYNTPYSLALPVLEGLRLAWERTKPFSVTMLWAVQPEVKDWIVTLPEGLRASCTVNGKVPKQEVLKQIGSARVLLAPSLVDGIPNTLYEAMALGTVPIVSPLKTIETVLGANNAIFARNLYPEEIAEAIISALDDEETGARITSENDNFIREHRSRSKVRMDVASLYEYLAKG